MPYISIAQPKQGVLSASFVHDLGQPTLAIALNAQMAENLLSKDRPELGKIKEAVVDIGRANDHAVAIIKQFRKLLKRRSDPEIQQETDLNAVIADTLSILSTEANHRQVVLVAEGHKGPLLVRADPIHVLQVLLNLQRTQWTRWPTTLQIRAGSPSGQQCARIPKSR
jgi:two-component system, LuxR family, sensor kinase FixL